MAREDEMDERTERWIGFELKPPEYPHHMGDPPWLSVALDELDVREVRGDGDNERIVEYHSATNAGEAPDSVPWCSSFANWCVKQAGIKGTGSKAARSWLSWRDRVDLGEPRRGAIVVFSRGAPPSGHVAFWLGEADGMVTVVGGNQGDAVSIAKYASERVLGYFWPRQYIDLLEPV